MFDMQSIQMVLLIWGSIFCLIEALCVFVSNNFDKQKRKWLMLMELSTSVLLISDVLAYAFRGYPGVKGYLMVVISNFIVFIESDIILMMFHSYVCSYLFPKQKILDIQDKAKRIKLVYIIGTIGIILVIISQFTNLYYYFDADNYYHRTPFYSISMIIAVTGMIIDFSLLIQYRKKLSPKIFLSLSSYITLPVVAAFIQYFVYGFSLINLAICISMVIMFIAATSEQNQEMYEVQKKKAEVEERLQISDTLNKCISQVAVSFDANIDEAIYNLLGVINEYFKADRSYIFKIDYEKDIIINTYEYAINGVSKEKDNLQEIPLDAISLWLESFKNDEVYYMSDLEQEKGYLTYEILANQSIYRLLAVPLIQDEKIIGFLGVDNPENHYDDATLLTSIQFFVMNSILTKQQKQNLEYLSYCDMLTKLYNRNKYINMIELYKNKPVKDVGIAYLDLNGLKKMNDNYGHEAGDKLICTAAQSIADVFLHNCYRIGGDEFVVVNFDIEEQDFYNKINDMLHNFDENKISVSIGVLWQDVVANLNEMLKKADKLMYEEKQRYHQLHKEYKRQ